MTLLREQQCISTLLDVLVCESHHCFIITTHTHSGIASYGALWHVLLDF